MPLGAPLVPYPVALLREVQRVGQLKSTMFHIDYGRSERRAYPN